MQQSGGVKRALGFLALAVLAWGSRLQVGPAVPAVFRADTLSATTSAIARGAEVYAKYGCRTCHDKKREGRFTNPNAGTGGQVSEVNFADEGYTRTDLRVKILGSTATRDERNIRRSSSLYRMPSWAGQMSEEEVSDLVEFLWNIPPKGDK